MPAQSCAAANSVWAFTPLQAMRTSCWPCGAIRGQWRPRRHRRARRASVDRENVATRGHARPTEATKPGASEGGCRRPQPRGHGRPREDTGGHGRPSEATQHNLSIALLPPSPKCPRKASELGEESSRTSATTADPPAHGERDVLTPLCLAARGISTEHLQASSKQ